MSESVDDDRRAIARRSSACMDTSSDGVGDSGGGHRLLNIAAGRRGERAGWATDCLCRPGGLSLRSSESPADGCCDDGAEQSKTSMISARRTSLSRVSRMCARRARLRLFQLVSRGGEVDPRTSPRRPRTWPLCQPLATRWVNSSALLVTEKFAGLTTGRDGFRSLAPYRGMLTAARTAGKYFRYSGSSSWSSSYWISTIAM